MTTLSDSKLDTRAPESNSDGVDLFFAASDLSRYWTLAHRIELGDVEFWPKWSFNDACKMIGIASCLSKDEVTVGLEARAEAASLRCMQGIQIHNEDIAIGIAGGMLRNGIVGDQLLEGYLKVVNSLTGLASAVPGLLDSDQAFALGFGLGSASPEKFDSFVCAVDVLVSKASSIPPKWHREILEVLSAEVTLLDPDLNQKLGKFVDTLACYTDLFAAYAEYPSVGRLFKRSLEEGNDAAELSLDIDKTNLEGSSTSLPPKWSPAQDPRIAALISDTQNISSEWIAKITLDVLHGSKVDLSSVQENDGRKIMLLSRLLVALQVSGLHEKADSVLKAMSSDVREVVLGGLQRAHDRRGSIYEQARVEMYRPVSTRDGVSAGVWSARNKPVLA